MKLLIYSHFFAPSVGGVETAVHLLARGLSEIRGANGEAGFEVTLATPSLRKDFDDAALPFRVVRGPGYLTLFKLIKRADVIHVAGPSLLPLWIAWCMRAPVVVEHHGYQAICLNGLLLRQPGATVCPGYFQARDYKKCLSCFAQETSWPRSMFKLLTMFPRGFLLRRVAANIAISRHLMNRQRLTRTDVVYYGIEDPLHASTQASLPDHPGPELCFAYVGRFVWEKGATVLLRAASLLRKEGLRFTVLLIGDGVQRPELEQLIQRENLSDTVTVTGYLRGADLATELERVDVVVMPSLCEETAGLSAIEQMMRGRLVIASAIGGLREIVEGAGLTFPAGDDVALAARMRAVIDNPLHFLELGQMARKRSLEFFQVQRMVDGHASIYHRIWRLNHDPTES